MYIFSQSAMRAQLQSRDHHFSFFFRISRGKNRIFKQITINCLGKEKENNKI